MNVVTVDDHELMLLGLRIAFQSCDQCTLVFEANDICTAWSFVEDNAADTHVVVTDISFPNGNGIEFCRRIKSTFPHIYVIIYSMNDSETAATEAILAKANGFIKKGSRKKTLWSISGQSCSREVISPTTRC